MMKKTTLEKTQRVYLTGILVFVLGALIGFSLIIFGESNSQYNLMAYGLILMLCFNIAFCCFRLKQRMVALLMHITVFLFLVSRITVSAIKGNSWWQVYSVEANTVAVYAIAFSLLSICIGVVIFEIIFHYTHIKKRALEPASREEKPVKKSLIKRESLRFVIRIVLAVCMICFFIREIDKVLFMSGRPYVDYYTVYTSRIPSLLQFPAGCMQIVLCAFLALKPSKKESFVWLAIYVVSALPMLKIGVRNQIMLNVIFAFLYYCLRSMHEKGWFGKIEKAVIIISIPAVVLFLGAYNYIRDGKAVDMSPVDLVVDFAYKQGTTYDTVLQGYYYQDQLFGRESKVYSFGTVTDTVLHNRLGELIFDAPDVGTGNCLRAAYNSNSLAHAVSYAAMGSDYIGGAGRGTSYIIETYLDFGYIGVTVFSVLLGAVCSLCTLLFGKKWFGSVVILNMLLSVLFIPRAETLSFIVFLFSYKFWIVIAGLVIAGLVVDKTVEKFGLKKYKAIRWILEK